MESFEKKDVDFVRFSLFKLAYEYMYGTDTKDLIRCKIDQSVELYEMIYDKRPDLNDVYDLCCDLFLLKILKDLSFYYPEYAASKI